MKKVVLFVILDQYADWEAAYISSAINMLGYEKYEIKTVSISKEPVISIGGFRTVPDYDINSVPKDYEAVLLIGGMTWRSDLAKQVKPLVCECFEKGKTLGGICDASAFLGTVGILNDVNHTSNDLKDLKNWAQHEYKGENKYIMRQSVRDKNIITANGTAAMEFAKDVLMALEVASEEKINEWYNFHKLGYYNVPLPQME